jgi:hypothetical protein
MSRIGQLLSSAALVSAIVLGIAGNAAAKSAPKPTEYFLTASQISLVASNHDWTGDYLVIPNPGFDKNMNLRVENEKGTYKEGYGLRQIDDYCVKQIRDRLTGMTLVIARQSGKIGLGSALGQLAGLTLSSLINPLNWRAVPGALITTFGGSVGGNGAAAEESMHAVVGALHGSCILQLVQLNPETRRLAIAVAPRLKALMPEILPPGVELQSSTSGSQIDTAAVAP